MASFEDLLELNNSVAELLADESIQFNERAAGLILLNTAAAAEVLSPFAFSALPVSLVNDTMDMVYIYLHYR